MSNEEMQRAIEFLLQNQARFDTRLETITQQFVQQQEQTNRQIVQMGNLIEGLADSQNNLTQIVTRHIEAQVEINRAVGAAQARTEATVNALGLKVDALTRRVDALTERVDVVVERVDALTGKVDTLTEQVSTLTLKVDAVTEQVSTLALKVDVVVERVDAVTQRVDTLASIIREDRNGKS